MSKHYDIQEVFNLIIDSGYYNLCDNFDDDTKSPYMCHALQIALAHGVIDGETVQRVIDDIHDYMNYLLPHSFVLVYALLEAFPALRISTLDMDAHEEIMHHCLPIYRDWSNRPLKEDYEY